jgi:hypothetical protein
MIFNSPLPNLPRTTKKIDPRSNKPFTSPLKNANALLEGCKSFHKSFVRLGYDNSTLNKPYGINCGVVGMLHH